VPQPFEFGRVGSLASLRGVFFPPATGADAFFYLTRQPFVLPGDVYQTIPDLGHCFITSPLPELSRLLAIMRDPLQLGAAHARRRKIARHRAFSYQ
jgi:hypothetical protein